MFNHIKYGVDPDSQNYDARLVVNFRFPYIEDTSLPVTICYYDLYSVILHELTHALGMVTGITEENTTGYYFPECKTNSFTRYDSLFLYYGSANQIGNLVKMVTFDSLGNPSIEATLASTQNCLRSNKIWLY